MLLEFLIENIVYVISASAVLLIGIIYLVISLSNKNKPKAKNKDIPTTKKQKKTTKKESPKKESSPFKDYGVFDTARAKEDFELDDEEMEDFLIELKGQIDDELPKIKGQIESSEFSDLKSSVHLIKGSAVNLGDNGIAQLLYDFNDYLAKGGKEKQELNKYYEDTKYYRHKF